MAKISSMSLDELYARKMTKSVEDAIIPKDTFLTISPRWCEKVCKLKRKAPSTSSLNPNLRLASPGGQVDILIVQDHKALGDTRFNKPGERIEKTNLSIIQYMADSVFKPLNLKYQVTSLLKCPVGKEDISKGKPPAMTCLLKCRPYLLTEISALQPRVILSLNTAVTKALGLAGKNNSSNRGEIVEYHGIPVVLAFHPRILTMLRQNSSGKFWGSDFYSVIIQDFKKAASLTQGQIQVPSLDAALRRASEHIHIARSKEDAAAASKRVLEAGRAGKVLSFDLETTSLDPMAPHAKIITAQFGWRAEPGRYEAVVFPMWHRENVWYNSDEIWPHIAEILSDEEIKKIGHNIKFDVLYTWFTQKVRVKGVFLDTMLMLHMINSGLQNMYGLKKAVADWLPETELAGYEDKLPKLTKPKAPQLNFDIYEEDEEIGEEDD